MKPLLITLALALVPNLVAAQSQPVTACQGQWQVKVDDSQAQAPANDPLALWIPAQVLMPQALADCAKQVVLAKEVASSLTLRAKGQVTQVELYNARRQQLPDAIGGRGKLLSLSPAGNTDFYLRIPQVFIPARSRRN